MRSSFDYMTESKAPQFTKTDILTCHHDSKWED